MINKFKKSLLSLVLGLSSLLIFTQNTFAVTCPECPQISNGGDNDTIGYVDGTDLSGDLTSSYTDNIANPLNSTSNILEVGMELAIIKEQRDLIGKVIPTATTVAKGQEIYYVLYVWNRANNDNSKQKATKIAIKDDLNVTAGVTYKVNSLQMINMQIGAGNDPTTEANWTTPATWLTVTWAAPTAPSDTADADAGCIVGNIVKIGLEQAGQAQVDIDVRKTVAIRFRVTVN